MGRVVKEVGALHVDDTFAVGEPLRSSSEPTLMAPVVGKGSGRDCDSSEDDENDSRFFTSPRSPLSRRARDSEKTSEPVAGSIKNGVVPASKVELPLPGAVPSEEEDDDARREAKKGPAEYTPMGEPTLRGEPLSTTLTASGLSSLRRAWEARGEGEAVEAADTAVFAAGAAVICPAVPMPRGSHNPSSSSSPSACAAASVAAVASSATSLSSVMALREAGVVWGAGTDDATGAAVGAEDRGRGGGGGVERVGEEVSVDTVVSSRCANCGTASSSFFSFPLLAATLSSSSPSSFRFSASLSACAVVAVTVAVGERGASGAHRSLYATADTMVGTGIQDTVACDDAASAPGRRSILETPSKNGLIRRTRLGSSSTSVILHSCSSPVRLSRRVMRDCLHRVRSRQ